MSLYMVDPKSYIPYYGDLKKVTLTLGEPHISCMPYGEFWLALALGMSVGRVLGFVLGEACEGV